MYEYVVYLLAIAAVLCIVRFIKGPTVPDRVIAIDAMSSLVIGIIVLLSLYFGNPLFMDIAIVYAILTFIGNLAISKYLMGKKLHEE
ncbi:MAG: cation:proton antiporter [Candidatus Aenigmarchaeota archaeon]|nr:cation:proton antiporter [Candidatus Aenigmarchaeota archaeon]